MSGHTPGPWTFAMDTEDQVAVLGNKEHPLICTVSKGYLRPHGEANARLIAAAPDLLEALRVAEEQLDAAVQNYATGEEDKTLAIVRAAIAKATGATS